MTDVETKNNSELSDSSFLIQLVYPAMLEMGLDVERVVSECRISQQLLKDRSARFPHSAQAQFWRVLENLSGDPLIGLHLAEYVPVHRGQVLEYLFLSSPNFGEGLRRTQNYQRLVTDAMRFELVEGEALSKVIVGFVGDDDPEMRHRNECFMRFIIRYFKAVSDGAFEAVEVKLTFAAAGDEEEYRRCFDCPVAFEQSEQAVIFNTDILAIPSARAEPELLKLHEKLANKQMERLSRQEIISDVKSVIAEMLELGQPGLESIAQRLGMNERVLRARLTEADTSFNQVLADYRCVLAKQLLARTDESIADVVYLTGFSEPSTFYRAFKRWTGLTPIEYRQQKQGE